MNIFVLHTDPRKAARWHADKHVIKMLLEAVQMLYTAHWVVAFPSLLHHRSAIAISQAQKKLPTPPALRYAGGGAPRQLKDPGQRGYRPVHLHHPCTVWVRRSLANYKWLCGLALALAAECKHRWPSTPPHDEAGHEARRGRRPTVRREHSCQAHAEWLAAHPPFLPDIPRTHFAEAMPLEYKKHDPIVSYRAFYKGSKQERGITKRYTNRHPPHWLSTKSDYLE